MNTSKTEIKKKHDPISAILLIIALILIGISLYKLIPLFKGYKDDSDNYEHIRKEAVVKNDAKGTPWYEMMRPDWDKLKKENPDIVAWQYNENSENISYPVLYSGDNTKYLRHNIWHKYSLSGCLFIDQYNHTDMSDDQTIIYGHNMRVGLMYGTLKRYKREPDYYNSHQYVQILTPTKAYRYRIFSYFDTDPHGFVYQHIYGDEDFRSLVNGLMKASMKDTGINVSAQDKIITMSTCSTTGNTHRFPVSAVLVSSYDYTTGTEVEEYMGNTDFVRQDATPVSQTHAK